MTASAAPGMRRASASASYGRSSAFDGMHAQNEHSPPTSRSSTIATVEPGSASRPAATSPAGPAPITTTSNVRKLTPARLGARQEPCLSLSKLSPHPPR